MSTLTWQGRRYSYTSELDGVHCRVWRLFDQRIARKDGCAWVAVLTSWDEDWNEESKRSQRFASLQEALDWCEREASS